MDPNLGLDSIFTGLGPQGRNLPALKLQKQQLETAPTPSVGCPPQMKKRLHKWKMKQDQDQFEMNNFCSNTMPNPTNIDKDYTDDHYGFKDFTPKPLDSTPLKRRRITEDSQDWSLSVSSHANFSTQSQSDQLATDPQPTHEECKTLDENSPIKNFQKFSNSSEEIRKDENVESSKVENTPNSPSTSKVQNQISAPICPLPPQETSIPQARKSSILEQPSNLQHLLSVARSLWCALKGKLLSSEVVSGRGGNLGLPFECWNHHHFIISLSALGRLNFSNQKSLQDAWCLKCRNFLHKTVERAQEMNSTVLDSCPSKGYVEVKWVNQHTFKIAYTKNHTKTWCEQCKIDEATRKQQEFIQKEKTEEMRKQREQQKLFEESQRYMEQQQSQRDMAFSNQQEAIYFEKLVAQVCQHAKKKMEKEMSSKDFKGEMTHTEIYNVYKILYMPDKVLLKTFSLVGKAQLNSYYRQLALLIHPDKNHHKYSQDAFTKLTNAFEMCKQIL